ncbi:NfeD family protein [Clostridium oceanicum]|uniref:NfeD family protein n=1 Tax=Clostridium oceanicum TaxID=1543 RepID=A0ABP3UNK6_9CLOT
MENGLDLLVKNPIYINIFWIVIGTIALIVDLQTSSFMFIWFTIGAIIALIAQVLGLSFITQCILFAIVSIVLLIVGYPLVKKLILNNVENIEVTEKKYIGKIFTIDKDVDEKEYIKFRGIYWYVNNKGEMIKKGDKVKIIDVKRNRLIIEKVKE